MEISSDHVKAITHTKELLEKQSQELKSWVDKKQLAVELAKQELLEAQKARNIIHSALTQIAHNKAATVTKSVQEVVYQKKDFAQLHNFIVSFMRTNKQQWKPTELRHQAVLALKTADEEPVVHYDDVQYILLNLRRAGKVVRPARGRYMWAGTSTAVNKPTKRPKREPRVAAKMSKSTKAWIKREVRKRLSSGGEYTVKNILDHLAFTRAGRLQKFDYSDGSIYQLVWNTVRQLKRNKHVIKVRKGKYRWTKVGKARADWMAPADKLLSLYVDLSASDILNFLKEDKHPASSLNAIQKYLERQHKQGVLKRTTRGRYAVIA